MVHARRVIFLLFLLSAPARAWLLPQTRREMLGVAWTTLSSLTIVDTQEKVQKRDDAQKKKKEKEEQRERDRIARETKARLAAGRIGTI